MDTLLLALQILTTLSGLIFLLGAGCLLRANWPQGA
jgi:hypothetical protein